MGLRRFQSIFWHSRTKFGQFQPSDNPVPTLKNVYYHTLISLLDSCIHSTQLSQLRMDRCQFCDPRWGFDHSSLFLADIFGQFFPQMAIKILKLIYYHHFMSVLDICSHSNQLGIDRGLLSDPRWEFDHFSHFSAILGQIRPISPLR